MGLGLPIDEKLEILKIIEKIGSRDFDTGDTIEKLKSYLSSTDSEIILSAIRVCIVYIGVDDLFYRILDLAKLHPEEEIRAMACGALGGVIQEGCEYEEKFQEEKFQEEKAPGEESSANPAVSIELYQCAKSFLLHKVDANMESMEVRRRALEALGFIGFLSEVNEIILRFFHHAPNPFVRVSAVYAMSMVKHPVFERLILEQLYSTQELVLMEAIHACANLELLAAEPRLRELTRDSSRDIAYESIVALSSVGDPFETNQHLAALEIEFNDPDFLEAISYAKESLKQRTELDKGNPGWNERLIWQEIQQLIDATENGEG